MNIQNELDKIGYVALKSITSAGIDIFSNKTGEKVATLSGDELIVERTPEERLDFIISKLPNVK